MTHFLDTLPTTENRWRALILLGRNTASYKFALGKALLDLKATPGDLLRLDELALPFALNLCEHLKTAPKQGAPTSTRRFAKAVRASIVVNWSLMHFAKLRLGMVLVM